MNKRYAPRRFLSDHLLNTVQSALQHIGYEYTSIWTLDWREGFRVRLPALFP